MCKKHAEKLCAYFIFLLFASAVPGLATSASFLPIDPITPLDLTTVGNWVGVYGHDGYIIPNNAINVSPSYGTVIASASATPYTWVFPSTDPRALLTGPGSSTRIASTYYTSSNFSFDINFTDGSKHQLALYLMDIETNGRVETISILDAVTNAVLDSRTLSSFHAGGYARWNIQGHVIVRVTYVAGLNAVVGALFFDPPSAGGASPAPPTVSLSSPSGGTVSGSVTVSANASSTAGIAAVQLQLDGANLGSAISGSGPYSVSWNTTTASNANHTLTAIATDTLGQSTTSAPVIVTASNILGPSATFVSTDITTLGNWKGVYGNAGYVIPNDSNNLPAYAPLTLIGAPAYTWLSSTADPRALIKGASTTDRIASTYYSSSSMTMDLNLTDNQSHPVALYFLDYDRQNRSQTITILDAGTSAVLDGPRVANNFGGGKYFVWNLQGHVQIRVTNTSDLNAVVSGLFLGNSGSGPANTPPTVSMTNPAGGTVSASVTVSATAAATTAGASMSSVQFQLDGANLGSAVAGSGPYSISWNTTTASNASHTLRAIATDSLNQQTTSAGVTVTVSNFAPPPPTVSLSNPLGGTVSASVTVSANASSTAGIASVQFQLDGLNLGGAVTGSGPYSVPWNTTTASNANHTLTAIATDTLNQSSTSSPVIVTVSNNAGTGPSATFVSSDFATQGNWKSVYGSAGYVIANDSNNLPAFATLSLIGAPAYTWLASTADPRALLKGASTTDRIASTYYSSSSMTMDLNLTDNQSHTIALYSVDFDRQSRSQTVTILNANTNAVLDGPRILANFSNGQYLVWNLQGHVLIRVTNTGNLNAVVSGLFFGNSGTGPVNTPPTVSMTNPVGGTVSASVTVSATAAATTAGATMSSVQFQLDGLNLGSAVAGSGPYSISWNTTTASNASHTLTAIATDSLNQHTTSTGVTVTVSNSTPLPTVSLSSPLGGTVSASVTVSANASSTVGITSVQFQLDGVNLGSPVTGSSPYSITWNTTAASNASHTLTAIATDTLNQSSTSAPVTVTVSNGSGAAPAATFVSTDTTTRGNWKGVYGSTGYVIANDSNNLPVYATLNLNGTPAFTWLGSTADVRALTKGASTTDRIASTYYSNAGITIDLNLTDNLSHAFALYCLDYDGQGRSQTITIVNASTNAVLDGPRTMANFSGGKYFVWSLQGHVQIVVSNTNNLNAVVSGLFFGNSATGPANTPPTVSMTNPTGGTVSGTVTVSAAAAATTSGAAISSVQFQLDGANLGSAVTGSSPYSIPWNTTAASNASHTLTAIATDTLSQSSTSTPVTVTVGNNSGTGPSATFVSTDTSTQGTWKGVYGQDGYVIASDSNSQPAYASLNFTGANQFSWFSTADPRALQQGNSTARVASVFYAAPSFTMDLNSTDGLLHQLALYFLDWDNAGRSETITILDANTQTILDTRTVSNFFYGKYLLWNVRGHVTVQFSLMAGSNAVVSGVFLSTPSGLNPPPPLNPTLSVSNTSLTFQGVAGTSNPNGQSVSISNLGSGTLNWTASKTQPWLTLSAASGTAPSSLGFTVSTAGLSAGTYTDTATIAAAGANGSPQTISVTLVVTTPPNLTLSSTSVSFSAITGGANPTGQSVNITNTGGGTLSWTASKSQSWLTLSAASGTAPSSLGFTISISGLSAGSYSDTVTVSGSGATGSPQSVTVNLTITQPPILTLSTTSASFSASMGSANPAGQSTNISNTGGGTLNWTATKAQPWLTLSASSGTAPSTLGFSVSISGLSAGTYNDTVTISATGATGSPQTVAVTLVVTQPPNLTLSTTGLNPSGTALGPNPAAQTVTITNTGGGTLNWTAVKNQSWVTLSAASGTAPSSMLVSFVTTGLATGTYSDTITITAPGATSAPQAISITLTLAAPVTPIGNWTFNTGTISGSTVLDTSGAGINGTIVGGVTSVAGAVGQALSFDGSTGYVITSPDPRPGMRNDMTITAWIRTTNSSRMETLVSNYNTSGNEDGYMLETTPAGYIGVHLGGNNIAGARDIIDGSNLINNGQWHHVALIIRPNQDVSFYVDGGLSSVYYLSTSYASSIDGVGLGGPATTTNNLFTGSMDEVRIYSRALSSSEIAGVYGGVVSTIPGGQILYNGIAMPKNFPPPTTPTQMYRTPYYINNPPRVLPINVGRQLFVDDFLIAQTTMQRTQHQANILVNPVLTPGSPISAGAWYSQAKQRYELWYYNTTNDYRYAYSNDGINWTLPTYPDVLVPNTNEVVAGGDTIWLDQQETDPSKRYKSFQVDAGALKVYMYFSADGIHWGPRQDFSIQTLSDRTSFFWNPFRNVWVNSDRGTAGVAATPSRPANITRARFYSESSNLTQWTPANPAQSFMIGPDDQDPPYYLNNPGGQPPELYNLDAVAYESVMVGLFSWFYPGLGYKDYTLPGPILVEINAGFSRDGFSWVRPTRGSGPNPGGAFIPASNIAGTWNAYNTQSAGGGFLVVGDSLYFYFSARTLQKPLDGVFSTGLAQLRRDGFYSMDAGATEATLTTRRVNFTGNHLFVNVNDPAGQLAVEVLDQNGNVIPQFSKSNSVTLSVDKTRQEVTWNGANLSSVVGQNVQFKFYLTNGSLYSFWVTPSALGASYGYVGAGGPGFIGVTDTVGSAGQ